MSAARSLRAVARKAFSPRVAKSALKVALVVGTLLNLINQGEHLLLGEARLIPLPLNVRWRAMSSASGLAAIAIPGAKGAVAIVAASAHAADEAARPLL